MAPIPKTSKEKNASLDGKTTPFIDPNAKYDVRTACAVMKVNSREINHMQRHYSDKVLSALEWQELMENDDIMFIPLVYVTEEPVTPKKKAEESK